MTSRKIYSVSIVGIRDSDENVVHFLDAFLAHSSVNAEAFAKDRFFEQNKGFDIVLLSVAEIEYRPASILKRLFRFLKK